MNAIEQAREWRNENSCGHAAKIAVALLGELEVARHAALEDVINELNKLIDNATFASDVDTLQYASTQIKALASTPAGVVSRAAPQVTDEQIARVYELVSEQALRPQDKRIVFAFARALLSEPPAAEMPKNIDALIEHIAKEWDECIYDAGSMGNLDVGSCIREAAQHYLSRNYSAAPQEANPVAADLETALTVFDMGLGFALCHRDFEDTRNAIKKLQADFTAIRDMLTIVSQEQAPAAVSVLVKEAGECQRVVRTGDQSLTLTFSSCRAASAFEKELRATPPTWAQSQPQQVTK